MEKSQTPIACHCKNSNSFMLAPFTFQNYPRSVQVGCDLDTSWECFMNDNSELSGWILSNKYYWLKLISLIMWGIYFQFIDYGVYGGRQHNGHLQNGYAPHRTHSPHHHIPSSDLPPSYNDLDQKHGKHTASAKPFSGDIDAPNMDFRGCLACHLPR